MNFESWLNELRSESNPETWFITKNCTSDFSNDENEWVDFVTKAFKIRGEKIQNADDRTSYLWHDKQACQLRFATSPCTPDNLPFQCKIRFVDDPKSIIRQWLSQPSFISWDELIDASDEEDNEVAEYNLAVWAVQHKNITDT